MKAIWFSVFATIQQFVAKTSHLVTKLYNVSFQNRRVERKEEVWGHIYTSYYVININSRVETARFLFLNFSKSNWIFEKYPQKKLGQEMRGNFKGIQKSRKCPKLLPNFVIIWVHFVRNFSIFCLRWAFFFVVEALRTALGYYKNR